MDSVSEYDRSSLTDDGMKATVYVDATIPSFYFDERPDPIVRAWRLLTREFWDAHRELYVLYASDETMRELSDEGYPADKRRQCLELVAALPRLAVTPEVIELADVYVRQLVMPSNDIGDAFHLAFATWYRLDFLLTWNCRHLANANKFGHIQRVNEQQRLLSPAIITPEQLLGKEIDL